MSAYFDSGRYSRTPSAKSDRHQVDASPSTADPTQLTTVKIIRASIYAPTAILRRTRRRWLRSELQKLDREASQLKIDDIDPEQMVICLYNGKLYRAEMQSSFEILLIDIQTQVTLTEDMCFYEATPALQSPQNLISHIERKSITKYTALEKRFLLELAKVCDDTFLIERQVIRGDVQLDTLFVKIPALGIHSPLSVNAMLQTVLRETKPVGTYDYQSWPIKTISFSTHDYQAWFGSDGFLALSLEWPFDNSLRCGKKITGCITYVQPKLPVNDHVRSRTIVVIQPFAKRKLLDEMCLALNSHHFQQPKILAGFSELTVGECCITRTFIENEQQYQYYRAQVVGFEEAYVKVTFTDVDGMQVYKRKVSDIFFMPREFAAWPPIALKLSIDKIIGDQLSIETSILITLGARGRYREDLFSAEVQSIVESAPKK